MPHSLTINGAGAVSHRLLLVSSSTTMTVRGVTFRNGGGTFSDVGGAIFNLGTLSLERCTAAQSTTTGNGGGLASYVVLNLDHCTMSDNQATKSGGLATYDSSTLTLDRSTVSGNYAGDGGGLDLIGGSTLTQCTLARNSARLGAAMVLERGPQSRWSIARWRRTRLTAYAPEWSRAASCRCSSALWVRTPARNPRWWIWTWRPPWPLLSRVPI